MRGEIRSQECLICSTYCLRKPDPRIFNGMLIRRASDGIFDLNRRGVVACRTDLGDKQELPRDE